MQTEEEGVPERFGDVPSDGRTEDGRDSSCNFGYEKLILLISFPLGWLVPYKTGQQHMQIL